MKLEYAQEIDETTARNWVNTAALTVSTIADKTLYLKGSTANEFCFNGRSPQWYNDKYLDYLKYSVTVERYARSLGKTATDTLAILTIGKQINNIVSNN